MLRKGTNRICVAVRDIECVYLPVCVCACVCVCGRRGIISRRSPSMHRINKSADVIGVQGTMHGGENSE